MVSGHSYLPNDRDFGCIETAKRRTQHVFVPADWESLILNCRKKNPFIVRHMKQEDFFVINELTKYVVNRKNKKEKQSGLAQIPLDQG
jgi:hypothetical protein